LARVYVTVLVVWSLLYLRSCMLASREPAKNAQSMPTRFHELVFVRFREAGNGISVKMEAVMVTKPECFTYLMQTKMPERFSGEGITTHAPPSCNLVLQEGTCLSFCAPSRKGERERERERRRTVT
jgi:hypothetical protein